MLCLPEQQQIFWWSSASSAATSGSSNTDACRRDMVVAIIEIGLLTKDRTALTHAEWVSTSSSFYISRWVSCQPGDGDENDPQDLEFIQSEPLRFTN